MGQDVRRIAILNRGEAATRALRAIRELRAEDGRELTAIALYTEPDRLAPFVREADEVLSLGPALRGTPGAERPAYLDRDRVMAALRAIRADSVWPGWGFLAEDPEFVERLEQAGIIFLGPSARVMRALGDKMAAKRLAESAGIPVLPWSGGPIERAQLRDAAARIGFPLLLKATAGGGGRGIRVIRKPDELEASFATAASEAEHAFGDGTLFVEALAPRARHIEVQMAADAFGTVLAVGLRDCSVQRRHQKVVEEGPPAHLPENLASAMRDASVRLLQRVGYQGVATCEYLVTADQSFFFLEVNPRLQVEHGVTELLTGVDLVKWQIRIARGEKLPAEVPEERGHAIEVRVCAEDPAQGFAPSPGRIPLLELPAGPGIRVDCGVAPGGEIPAAFDSMIAKVIAHGATREEARTRLLRALSDLRLVVDGGMVNKGFLLDVVSSPAFRDAACDTTWLDRESIARAPEPRIEALLVAAILTYQRERAAVRSNFFIMARGGRPRQIPASTGAEIDLVYAGHPYRLKVFAIGGWTYRIHLGGRVVEIRLLEQGPYLCQLLTGSRRFAVLYSESDVEYRVELEGRLHRVQCDLGGRVRALAPALVIQIDVEPGQSVEPGQRLGVLEAMKTETAFFAPLGGVVREILSRPGERVAAGDVLLVIEPSAEATPTALSPLLELPLEEDPLALLLDADGEPNLGLACQHPAGVLAEAVRALRSELHRILTGYDVNPVRAELLVRVLEAPLGDVTPAFRSELSSLVRAIEIFVDVETLFSRAPSRPESGELGPSNDARMATYLRRIEAEGAGIDPAFLDQLRRTLAHYGVESLGPDAALRRATLRLFATRTTIELRSRLAIALMSHAIELGEMGETFARFPMLEEALDGLALLRGTIERRVADVAAQARFALFERPRRELEGGPRPPLDLERTIVAPPDRDRLRARAREVGLSLEQARRIELWRLDNFELERLPVYESEGVFSFHARARDQSGDERLICLGEALDLGPGVPSDPDPRAFEQSFLSVVEAMRGIQRERDPEYRLQWNRLYLFIRPPIVLTERLLAETVRRLAPETSHLGIEKVLVRIAQLDPREPLSAAPRLIEVVASNPTGGRVEYGLREPHQVPLQPATPYEQRVALARVRGLVYPYEIVRLFSAEPARPLEGPAAATGPGRFVEYELEGSRAVPISRPPGGNPAGVVIGTIETPTRKFPEGMRRVLILSDPTYGMGALATPECDRIVAAFDLAEREGIPIEWVAVSSGARIAFDSGTENLDATARVVRRIVTFTDQGGEVNLIVPGVNVGAQSYFDALATMGMQTRGVLIMLAQASMVLTGRAALEFSGGVSAEDEVAMGGYERIMGPNGEAHFQARDLADAYRILLENYATSYRMPGEPRPRSFATSDPAERDVTLSAYEGDEGFSTIGDLFAAEHNAERKRPFAMRPLLRALADADGLGIERWRDWAGAETAIVLDAHVGGQPVTLIGIESRPTARDGYVPPDGPETWTAATLFPLSSKKVARAINAASGQKPVVLLANLSGFDGSPESMRRGVLEWGAEIARAVVRFSGLLLFVVVSRYHGGAYVVFSRELSPSVRALALRGSFASVIGGPAAAAVVFPREVRKRALEDPAVREARTRADQARDPAERVRRRAEQDRILDQAMLESRAAVAAEFDAIHSVERALEVGSLEALLHPSELRPTVIHYLNEAARSRP